MLRAALPLLLLTAALGLAACGERTSSEHGETARIALETHAGIPVPDPQRVSPDDIENPGTPWGDYVGSAACQPCHEDLYKRWRGSFHSRTLYAANDRTVIGDFSGETEHASPESPFVVRPSSRVDATGKRRYYMEIRPNPESNADLTIRGEEPAGLAKDPTFEVLYAFGNRQHQPYVARRPGERNWVLPVYWDDEQKHWRYDGFRPYVRSCARCHVTGVRTQRAEGRDDPRPLPFMSSTHYVPEPDDEGWADGAVGCEMCHGPGREHVASVERVGVEAYRKGLADGTKAPTIYDGNRASHKHQLDLCGQCHNFFTEDPVTWKPGPQGFSRDPLYAPLQLTPGNVGFQFYADGSDMSPCTVIKIYGRSKMGAEQIGCSKCHDPHGTDHWADLTLSVEDNALCITCHEPYATEAAQTAHSRHATDSAGNRCHECHMPRHMRFSNGIHTMSKRIPSHAFSIPTGEQLPGGPPPSCNVCHVDKDAKWTRGILKRWRDEKR